MQKWTLNCICVQRFKCRLYFVYQWISITFLWPLSCVWTICTESRRLLMYIYITVVVVHLNSALCRTDLTETPTHVHWCGHLSSACLSWPTSRPGETQTEQTHNITTSLILLSKQMTTYISFSSLKTKLRTRVQQIWNQCNIFKQATTAYMLNKLRFVV